jgi:peptidoglycan hydrolase CwlO-like protein
MKGILQTTGIRDIKSIRSIGARSIPKAQRSSYLELYVLGSEKNRLEKEIFALDKRINAAKKQFDSICNRIKQLQKETRDKQEIKTYKDIPTKPLKTMPINY